jgi:hypothetical protein
MKKIIALFVFAIISGNIYAACTPAATAPPIDGGFFPASNSQPCVVKSEPVSGLVIQLKNFGNITNDVFVISTRIDTVLGLPSGLSWNMTVPSANSANTLLTDEIGCIEITGSTNAPIGNYDLDFAVTVEVSLSGNVQTIIGRTSELVQVFNSTFGTEADFSYYLNVVNNQSECTHTVGIQELTNVSNLNIYPNPFSDKTVVSFNSIETTKYTARIIDVMGKEVYTESINAASGMNKVEVNAKNISSGMYFIVLSNGKATSTKRLVVE